MTIEVRKISDTNYRETIEVTTLEELMTFIRGLDDDVIMYRDSNVILIYDDYYE